MAHVSVLTEASIDALNLQVDSVVVDCTLGAGGHAGAILRKLGPGGTYVGFDVDATAIAAQEGALKGEATIHLVAANFRTIKAELSKRNLTPTAILADFGWRSEQFEGGGKGLSFNYDEPLDMTYGSKADYPFTAFEIVNDWDESSIADIIFGYGEERAARRIAAAIVAARRESVINSSKTLAEIVSEAVPVFRRKGRIHPATQTFQALRIAVNDELGAITDLLRDGFEALAPGGRMAMITFHSLEDRLVKRFFKQQAHDTKGHLVTKKPITATKDELAENPRSRSAKLRILEKL